MQSSSSSPSIAFLFISPSVWFKKHNYLSLYKLNFSFFVESINPFSAKGAALYIRFLLTDGDSHMKLETGGQDDLSDTLDIVDAVSAD